MSININDVVINKQNNRLAIVIGYEHPLYQINYVNTDGYIFEDIDEVHPELLQKVKPFDVPIETIEKYLKLEIEPKDFVPKGNTILGCNIIGKSTNPVKLMLDSIKAIRKKGMTADKFTNWYSLIHLNNGPILHLNNDRDFPTKYDDNNVLSYVDNELNMIKDVRFSHKPHEQKDTSVFDESINILTYYLEDKDLPLSKKRITDSFAFDIIDQYNEDTIDKAPRETQTLFKKCVNQLCDIEWPSAIQKKAYCMYRDTKVFPQNWSKCTKLFEKHYLLTGDPNTANTLGYIYYYGRANKGIPDYDKAFKYFSIGNAALIYESAYKLGDCFRNGYGVIKNDNIAYKLYSFVLENTKEEFLDKDFTTKFADAALRIAICFEEGVGVIEGETDAYYWYLQAEYAIRRRRELIDYYGDEIVALNISRSISAIRDNYKDYSNKITAPIGLPLINQLITSNDIRVHIDVIRNNNGNIKLIASLTKSPSGEHQDIFLAIPEFDFCSFVYELTYHLSEDANLINYNLDKDYFVFNEVDINETKETATFYLDGEEVAVLKANEISVNKNDLGVDDIYMSSLEHFYH